MNDIQLKLDDKNKGAFIIEDGGKIIAEMAIEINDGNLTVYHTEVAEELQGQGISKKLLENMVNYARQHQLKVIALCPYVSLQFQRHPDLYGDVWNKSIKGKFK
jgi:predicted GNAT family acetyltransferase